MVVIVCSHVLKCVYAILLSKHAFFVFHRIWYEVFKRVFVFWINVLTVCYYKMRLATIFTTRYSSEPAEVVIIVKHIRYLPKCISLGRKI